MTMLGWVNRMGCSRHYCVFLLGKTVPFTPFLTHTSCQGVCLPLQLYSCPIPFSHSQFQLDRSIENATRCLVNYTRSNSDDICTYTLALTSYALAQTRDRNRNNVIAQLKKEIKTSVDCEWNMLSEREEEG